MKLTIYKNMKTIKLLKYTFIITYANQTSCILEGLLRDPDEFSVVHSVDVSADCLSRFENSGQIFQSHLNCM